MELGRGLGMRAHTCPSGIKPAGAQDETHSDGGRRRQRRRRLGCEGQQWPWTGRDLGESGKEDGQVRDQHRLDQQALQAASGPSRGRGWKSRAPHSVGEQRDRQRER